MSLKRSALFAVLTIVLTIVLLTSGVYAYRAHKDYIRFSERLSELGGVRIGESKENLLYSNGRPFYVGMQNSPDEMFATSTLFTKEANLNKYRVWSWVDDLRVVDVEFDERGKVISIGCSTAKTIEQGHVCTTAGGVSMTGYDTLDYLVSSSENTPLSSFGEPDAVFYDEPAGIKRKILTYNKLGLQLIYARDRLVRIDKTAGQPDFFWWLFNSRSDY
jgi:hypothetical protein